MTQSDDADLTGSALESLLDYILEVGGVLFQHDLVNLHRNRIPTQTLLSHAQTIYTSYSRYD